MRNPISGLTNVQQWTQGIGVTEVAAGAIGLYGTGVLPNMLFKNTTNKFARVAISLAAAVGIAYVVRKGLGPKAGQAAAIGGLAGASLTAVSAFTPFKVGTVSSGQPLSLPIGRRIGDAGVVSPSFNRTEETVNMIMP